MYLQENLTRLNNLYNSKGLTFIIEGNFVKIVEEEKYLFNNFKRLKE